MNPAQSLATFGICTAAIFLLPTLPVIRTWFSKNQTSTKFCHEYDPHENITAFRNLVSEQFANLLNLARRSGPIRGANENGQPFIVLDTATSLVSLIPPKTRRLRNLVLSAGHLEIPNGLACEREMFAEGNILIASHSLARGVLSLRNIIVGRHARVLRWISCNQCIEVQETAILKGWAEAGQEIRLARRSRFSILQAPVILFGRQPESILPEKQDTVSRFELSTYNPLQPCYGRHLEVPPRHSVKNDLFVSHQLIIGDQCHVIGNLSSDGSIDIGNDVIIIGSIHANGPINIGARCLIRGPVVSHKELQLGFRCTVGHISDPTTVQADTLLLHEGCVAYGCVHALNYGEVLTDERSAR